VASHAAALVIDKFAGDLIEFGFGFQREAGPLRGK
jgi:hypothetical protein